MAINCQLYLILLNINSIIGRIDNVLAIKGRVEVLRLASFIFEVSSRGKKKRNKKNEKKLS